MIFQEWFEKCDETDVGLLIHNAGKMRVSIEKAEIADITIEHIATQDTSDSFETFDLQVPKPKAASKLRSKWVQRFLIAGIILTGLSILAIVLIVTHTGNEEARAPSSLSSDFQGTTGTTLTGPPSTDTPTGQESSTPSPSIPKAETSFPSASTSNEQTKPISNPALRSTFRPTGKPTTEQTDAPSSAEIEVTVSPTISPVNQSKPNPTTAPTTEPTLNPTNAQSANTAPACPDFDAPPPLPGKKGIGMTLRKVGEKGSWLENLPRVIALDVHWNYSWGSRRIEEQPDDIEFVPMIWGSWNKDKTEQQTKEALTPHIETGKVKRLLGFNEPDSANQANMPVERAVQTWPVLESSGLPLVSPSAVEATGPWMLDFMSKSEQGCNRVDWIGVHWYGGVNFQSFINNMESIYDLYKRPLLITEFAPADWTASTPADNRWSQADVLGFMKAVLPWLEEQEWIAGYAWFPFNINSAAGTSSALFDDNGNMTALGRYYTSVRSNNPIGDQTIQVGS